MDFASRLKRRHLNDIIQYLKHNGLPTDLDEEEKDENFDENCLFIGLMAEEESEQARIVQSFNQKEKTFMFISPDDESDTEVPRIMNQIYDPANIKSEFSYPNISAYSPALLKELEVSQLRYKHYLSDPDGIRQNEISKYNKEWMSNALNLIYPTELLKSHSATVKNLFQEILDTYTYSMKRAILDYILRSPAERKRLHILMIPREIPTSSYKIAIRGGYSTKLFQDWHKAKKDVENEVKLKMICNNIVMGSLVSWWHDFRDIKLIRFDGIKAFCDASGFTLSFDIFLKVLYMYRIKTLMLLKDVWHRGAIMIIKKFKYLKRRGSGDGNWTFSGFHPKNKQDNCMQVEPDTSGEDSILKYIKLVRRTHNTDPIAVQEGLEFDAMLTHLFNDIEMDELVDIRENSAYVAFVQLIGGYINYEEDGYEILAKEYKRELKYSGGNLMALQLREIIDRSVEEFTKFFTNIPDFEDFNKCFEEIQGLRRKASQRFDSPSKRQNVSSKNISSSTMSYKPPTKHTTSHDLKFTKTGTVMTDEHK